MINLYDQCPCCSLYFFEETINKLNRNTTKKLKLNKKSENRLNDSISAQLQKYRVGRITLNCKKGFVVGYEYATEFEEELVEINEIKNDITTVLKTFDLVI
jgi:hypothetical protein